MRHSSFPPELQKFVDTVEEKAQVAGHSSALARIFGAWAACFVRFCTVHDRSWREAKHVDSFLTYLKNRKDVDQASRKHAAQSLVFLFEKLLKTDVSEAAWHPENQSRATGESAAEEQEADKQTSEEEGEQSTLLTRLLFHTSLPINEALDLCAGDVDLDAGLVYVSDPMGTPKRIVELPDVLYDPLRRHLERLRKKHGRRYFDAPLFQARALQGRRSEMGEEEAEDNEDESEPDQTAEPVAADAGDDGDRPASLWGYAEDE
jgi:integrase